MKIQEPVSSFFDIMIKNNDNGYHNLTKLMDKYLIKDILNDTMFELFLAIRKYAFPDSIVEIKAEDKGDYYILWSKFSMPAKDLLKFDVEVQKANDMIDKAKEEIIESRMHEYRNETPRVLDGFKMVMAYAHSAINYATGENNGSLTVQIQINLPKRKA